jgi:hypothetical protein
MKKSIRDTYVYKVLDLETTIKNCGVVNSDLQKYALKPDVVEAILNEFKFKISFPAKVRVIEEIKAGRITFVDTELVSALPTWMVSTDGMSVKTAVVNLFGKMKIKEDGTAQFNSREIFALAVIALTVRDFYQNEKKVTYNLNVTKLAVKIYERMMYRVLDTLYSLDVGPEWLRASVRMNLRMFCAAYVMEKHFNSGTDYDNVYNYILQDIPRSKEILTRASNDSGMSMECFQSLPAFIEFLTKMHPILKDLDITTFLRKYIMMYGERALLMIENYHYFLAYIFSVTLSGNIIKDFALETSVGKEGIQLYNTYFDLMK